MQITRFDDAAMYVPPKHSGCACFRVQGQTVTAVENFWMGVSHFLPEGGAESDSSPYEKTYFVIAGEVTVEALGESATLHVNDSCYIPAHEVRILTNKSKLPATILVVIATSAKGQ